MAYNEFKYLVYDKDIRTIISFLQKTSLLDDKYPFGTIETVYYDSLNFDSFKEAFDGYTNKKKYRVRRYLDSDKPNLQLQVKYKNMYQVNKIKLNLNSADKVHYIWSEYMKYINPNDKSLLYYCFFQSRPFIKTMSIKYDRFRFKFLDYRVNIDFNIRFETMRNDLLISKKVDFFKHAVLEIKTKANDIITPTHYFKNLTQTSFSKYAIGMYMLNRNFEKLGKYY